MLPSDRHSVVSDEITYAQQAMTAELLTLQAAAARLTVSPRTLQRMAARREIASVHIGRGLRFFTDDLEAYISRHYRPAELPRQGRS